MYVYNITSKVDPGISGEWVRWQKEVHIPEILATGHFSGFRMYELLEQDASEGSTYVVQFLAPDLSHYREYMTRHDPGFRGKALLEWGNSVLSFRTLLSEL